MNCKNCGYGLKQRCGDFEKIICTYEEGECVKITELKAQLAEQKQYTAFKCEEAKKTITDLEYKLTKAKDIIKKFSEFVNNENEYGPEHPQEHTDLWNKLCAEAEQFLNCSEKPNN